MLLNNAHSQFNPANVAEVVRPTTLQALCEVVKQAQREGVCLSVAGARHAMGGQQLATQQRRVGMTGLTRVLDNDATQGLPQIGAGANWLHIITAMPRASRWCEPTPRLKASWNASGTLIRKNGSPVTGTATMRR